MSMTKEKEEVIKRLEKLVELRKNKAEQIKYDNCICGTEDLETVLNMLKEKKKDKEIEKLKEHNKDLLRKLRNRVKEVNKLNKYSLYKKEFSRLNEQLKNKDKQINLMAEFLGERDLGYYKNEVGGEIMGIMRKYNKEDWKQYFERKSKE